MARHHLATLLLLTLMLLAAPCVTRAAESYDNCTSPDAQGQMTPHFITSLPAVITSQGTWCLAQDLTTPMTAGAAITISANNVTIDCNYFKIGGLSAGNTTGASGIYAYDRLNATVRNCNIRGFLYGLYFGGSVGGGHVVEDNRFDGNTYAAVFVEGDGSIVRHNRVLDTGGTLLTGNAFGISTHLSVDILDNTVSGVFARPAGGGSAYGIYASGNNGGRIVGNGVKGLVKDGTGVEYGIYNTPSSRFIVRSNDVVGNASVGSIGLSCINNLGSAKDNVISGFAIAIASCSDSGGNAVIP